MGLGRLNPGCGCDCAPLPPPLNDCQRASQIIMPQSMSVSGPAFSLADGEPTQWGPDMCAQVPFIGGSGQTSYTFPPYYEEVFCGNSIGVQWGLSWPNVGFFFPGKWPLASFGACKFYYTNHSPGGSFTFQSGIGQFGMAFQFGLQNDGRPYGYVGLSCSMLLAYFIQPDLGFCDELNDYPFWSGVVDSGANYTRNPYFNGIAFNETSHTNRRSTAQVNYIGTGVYPSCFFFGADCSTLTAHCFAGVGFSSRSEWQFYFDDPQYGSQRDFNLWIPSPVIDPFGAVGQSVSGSIAVGI